MAELSEQNLKLVQPEFLPGALIGGDIISLFPGTLNRLLDAARAQGSDLHKMQTSLPPPPMTGQRAWGRGCTRLNRQRGP